MMKKTGFQHLRKTIRKNAVSFFAVALIAAVSIAIYLGIQSAVISIRKDADRYFNDNRLASLEIACGNGITQEDIEALSRAEGISLAAGGYKTMVTSALSDKVVTLHALSLCHGVNDPYVVAGKLPEGPGQVAVEQKFADKEGIQLGDPLTLDHGGALTAAEFTVTAIINYPAYCCATANDARGVSTTGLGAADYCIVLPEQSFDKEHFGGTYTTAYLRAESLEGVFFYSAEYAEKEEALKAQIAVLSQERSQLRYEAILEQAKPAIDAGLISKEDFSHKEWILSGREEMGDVAGVEGLAGSVGGISYSLSLVFLLVAVVVCYSAISRMIEEQRALIGAQKALGFTSGEILGHYMYYSLLCAGCGIGLGWLISVLPIEFIVLFILKQNFYIGDIPICFGWTEAALSAGICLVIFLLTTYLTCRKLVRLPATVLLQGNAPIRGRRYFFENWRGYRKMNLYSRTMLKNVLSDPGRMLTTVIGVVGCIALLVICLSLKLAIDGAYTTQFNDYFLYENRLVTDTSAGNTEDFEAVLQEEGIAYARVQDKLTVFRAPGGDWMTGRVMTAKDAGAVEDFLVLKDRNTGKRLPLPEDGVLISRKCADVYDLKAGDTLEILDDLGEKKEFRVAGVIDHYLRYHLFVTSDSYYTEVMGTAPQNGVFLLQGSIEGLYDRVRPMDGFMVLKDNTDQAEDTAAIYMAVAVCLALSVVMALMVLLNQIVMHINRKARELAVMRINGYTLKETKAYIYKDNIVLTVIGLILGCGVGMVLSNIVIYIMEREPSSYVYTPNPMAYLIACGVGALFSLGVNIIALRKIDKLNLTHVNGN